MTDEPPSEATTPPRPTIRTLGDVHQDGLKIRIECRSCYAREGYYPYEMPGWPDQPVRTLVRRKICEHCYSKEFEIAEVIWCMELERGPGNAEERDPAGGEPRLAGSGS